MMHAVHPLQGYEFSKALHEAMLEEVLRQQEIRRALKPHRTQVAAYVRFFRMYHLRRLLFRFAPRFAERVAL